MKVGPLVQLANALPENTPRRYEALRAIARGG